MAIKCKCINPIVKVGDYVLLTNLAWGRNPEEKKREDLRDVKIPVKILSGGYYGECERVSNFFDMIDLDTREKYNGYPTFERKLTKEEITNISIKYLIKAAIDYAKECSGDFNPDIRDAFIHGAEWAKEHINEI